MTNNFTKWKPISGFLKMPISKDALMSKTGPNFKLIFGEGLSCFLVKKIKQIYKYVSFKFWSDQSMILKR